MLSRQPSRRGEDLQLCSNRPLNDTHCASKVALRAQRSAGEHKDLSMDSGCRAAAETGGCPAATQRRRTEGGGARRSL
jgi:hypothetical protein